jgi:hypothetical protein
MAEWITLHTTRGKKLQPRLRDILGFYVSEANTFVVDVDPYGEYEIDERSYQRLVKAREEGRKEFEEQLKKLEQK